MTLTDLESTTTLFDIVTSKITNIDSWCIAPPQPPTPPTVVILPKLKALNNSGPPYFVESIQTEFNMTVGDKITYIFPNTEDPDNDKI